MLTYADVCGSVQARDAQLVELTALKKQVLSGSIKALLRLY
jgi:hypothetical protein